MYQPFVHVPPVAERAAVRYLHRYVLERLLVALLCHLGHYLLLVNMLFQRKQYLHGVYWLNEIVGNLCSYRLIHVVFFLAFGHHYHGSLWLYLFDALQGLQSCDARHHLVKQNKVEGLLLTLLYCVNAVVGNDYVIAFLFKGNYVGVQMFYLVIHP